MVYWTEDFWVTNNSVHVGGGGTFMFHVRICSTRKEIKVAASGDTRKACGDYLFVTMLWNLDSSRENIAVDVFNFLYFAKNFPKLDEGHFKTTLLKVPECRNYDYGSKWIFLLYRVL